MLTRSRAESAFFDIDDNAKRKWAHQFLTGEALKWYPTQHTSSKTWDEFQQAVRTSDSSTPEPTRASTSKQILTRKQTMEEKFIQYLQGGNSGLQKHEVIWSQVESSEVT
ncbi:unnamed protein product [Didymodactylos carnosus]|uniref:Retrotransposon gag domain-containing protein n=1 Tax=Didymodactylos carnosus TaxID=1234261 RepID=A0A8S2EC71_9BILA|nr:unnamed protein product [Didymodactylos carnosus]CAF3917877.1 unnamed protein product [Didymodactylos carnosus]